MNTEVLKEYVTKYLRSGNDKFYHSILFLGLQKIVLIINEMYRGLHPHLEYLRYYEQFIILYRREGEQIYLNIGKMFRRAAHRIYRIMLRKSLIPVDNRFLNSV